MPEVIIGLLNVSVTMVTTASLPQILKGTCYYVYGHQSFQCSSLEIKKTSEHHLMQSTAAMYTSVFRFVISVPSLFTGLYFGTSSDRIGEKLPVILSIAGIVLGQLLYITSDSFRSHTIELIFAGALVMGISGNVETVGVCLLAYTSNHTTVNIRTFKIGLLTGSSFLGKFIGAILAGIMLKWYSFQETYALAVAISSASFFLCIICLQESTELLEAIDAKKAPNQNSQPPKATMCSPFTDICKFVSRKRDFEPQLYLIVVSILSFLGTICYTGSWDMINLIIKRPELGLDDATFGFIRGLGAASNAFALLIFQGILTQICGVSDIVICTAGSLASVLRYSIFVFSEDRWAIWTCSAIQGLGVMLNSASISLASKQVAPEEQGKLMAVLQVPQFLGNAIGTPVFAAIYAETFEHPRVVFLFPACTHIALTAILAVMLFWKKLKS